MDVVPVAGHHLVSIDFSPMEALTVLALVFLLFVAPIWLIGHYLTRWRAIRGLAARDEQLLSDLWDAARRFEERIENLEQATGFGRPQERGADGADTFRAPA